MNSEQILRAIGGISDPYIEEAAGPALPRAKRVSLYWAGGAAVACLVAAVVGWWFLYRSSSVPSLFPDAESSPSYIQPADETDELARVIPWDELSISQQYSLLAMDDREYDGTAVTLPAEKQGVSLGIYTLSGYNEEREQTYTKQAEVFAISGIATECAVAVQFEEEASLYVYHCWRYIPATLGQFVDDLSLWENLQTGVVYEETHDNTTREYFGLSTEVVVEMLLSDTDAPYTEFTDDMAFTKIMDISVDVPLLGYTNISLAVTEQGYLTTNILDTGKAFSIGEDKVQAFVAYVQTHCTCRETIDSHDEEEGIPE